MAQKWERLVVNDHDFISNVRGLWYAVYRPVLWRTHSDVTVPRGDYQIIKFVGDRRYYIRFNHFNGYGKEGCHTAHKTLSAAKTTVDMMLAMEGNQI